MVEPIYQKPLRALDHRLIWFLLSHQVIQDGKPTGTVAAGWRQQAIRELKTYRTKLYEAEKRLKAAGVIACEPRQRNVRIIGEAFQ